jgi:hypothetical protein
VDDHAVGNGDVARARVEEPSFSTHRP